MLQYSATVHGALPRRKVPDNYNYSSKELKVIFRASAPFKVEGGRIS